MTMLIYQQDKQSTINKIIDDLLTELEQAKNTLTPPKKPKLRLIQGGKSDG